MDNIFFDLKCSILDCLELAGSVLGVGWSRGSDDDGLRDQRTLKKIKINLIAGNISSELQPYLRLQ